MDDLEEVALVGSDISTPTKPVVTLFLHRPIYNGLDAHPVKIENGLLKVPTSPHLSQAHTISLLSLVTLDGNRKDDLDFRKYIFIDWRQNKDLKYLKNTFRKGNKNVKPWRITKNGTLPNLPRPKKSGYYVMYRRIGGDGKDPEYERVNIQLKGEETLLNTADAIELYSHDQLAILEDEQRQKTRGTKRKREANSPGEFPSGLTAGTPSHGRLIGETYDFEFDILQCNTLITKHLRCYSDERLKEDKKPVPDEVLPALRKLQQYTYKWKDGTRDAGPMAQDIFQLFSKLIPGVVTYEDGTVPTSLQAIRDMGFSNGKLVVQQNAINMLQTKAIQELAKALDSLEQQVVKNTGQIEENSGKLIHNIALQTKEIELLEQQLAAKKRYIAEMNNEGSADCLATAKNAFMNAVSNEGNESDSSVSTLESEREDDFEFESTAASSCIPVRITIRHHNFEQFRASGEEDEFRRDLMGMLKSQFKLSWEDLTFAPKKPSLLQALQRKWWFRKEVQGKIEVVVLKGWRNKYFRQNSEVLQTRLGQTERTNIAKTAIQDTLENYIDTMMKRYMEGFHREEIEFSPGSVIAKFLLPPWWAAALHDAWNCYQANKGTEIVASQAKVLESMKTWHSSEVNFGVPIRKQAGKGLSTKQPKDNYPFAALAFTQNTFLSNPFLIGSQFHNCTREEKQQIEKGPYPVKAKIREMNDELKLAKNELTENQKHAIQRYEEVADRNQYLCIHIYGPAGTGKTYVALDFIQRELQSNSASVILVACTRKGFAKFIARWIVTRVLCSESNNTKMTHESILNRIHFCTVDNKGETMKAVLKWDEKRLELEKVEKVTYNLVVVDEAHHIIRDAKMWGEIYKNYFSVAGMRIILSDPSQDPSCDTVINSKF